MIFLLMLSSGAGSLFSRLWLPRTNLGWVPLRARHCHASRRRFLPAQPSGGAGRHGLRLSPGGQRRSSHPAGICHGHAVPYWPARAGRRCPRPNFPPGTAASDNAVEWAWAMNAAASVLGSVSAMVIAIQFGLTVTLACGAGAYLLALLCCPRSAAKQPSSARFLLSCCEGVGRDPELFARPAHSIHRASSRLAS